MILSHQWNMWVGYLIIIKGKYWTVLHKNICYGYSLELPRRGNSNEYPQHIYGKPWTQSFHLHVHIEDWIVLDEQADLNFAISSYVTDFCCPDSFVSINICTKSAVRVNFSPFSKGFFHQFSHLHELDDKIFCDLDLNFTSLVKQISWVFDDNFEIVFHISL